MSRVHPDELPSSATTLFDILPLNAKKYYRAPNENSDSINEIVYRPSADKQIRSFLGLFLIYPIFRIRYLAANEIMVVLESGEHRVYVGPGLKWYKITL
jgi:hypothetical protein